MVGEPVHRALCPHTTLDFYIPPPLARRFENEGGPFLYRWGGVTLVKHWTRLYRFLQLSETNSGPTFRAKDPGLNGGYGYGGA